MTTTTLLTGEFDRTLNALEQGLLVRCIMSSPLQTVGPEEDVATFFAQHKSDGFDCAPVRKNGRIIGMVYMSDVPPEIGAHCAEAIMRPLHLVPMVAATEPLSSLIHQMRSTNQHFWLVLDGTEIDAIVTRSDLWKLPVRLLAICRVVHLERLMHQIIALHVPDDSWMDAFNEERRHKLRQVIDRARERNELLDALESTSFSDKVEILRRTLKRGAEANDLGGISDLRNQLMHARDGNDAEPGILKFLERMQRIDELIAKFTAEMHPDR